MPCRDGGYEDEVRVSRKTVSDHEMLEASMCGLLTQLEKEGVIDLWLSNVDWAEELTCPPHIGSVLQYEQSRLHLLVISQSNRNVGVLSGDNANPMDFIGIILSLFIEYFYFITYL